MGVGREGADRLRWLRCRGRASAPPPPPRPPQPGLELVPAPDTPPRCRLAPSAPGRRCRRSPPPWSHCSASLASRRRTPHCRRADTAKLALTREAKRGNTERQAGTRCTAHLHSLHPPQLPAHTTGAGAGAASVLPPPEAPTAAGSGSGSGSGSGHTSVLQARAIGSGQAVPPFAAAVVTLWFFPCVPPPHASLQTTRNSVSCEQMVGASVYTTLAGCLWEKRSPALAPLAPAPGAVNRSSHTRLGVADLRHGGDRRAGYAAPARCCCHRVAPRLNAAAAGLAAASPATPRAGAVNRACPGVTRLRHCRRGRAGGAAPARCCCHRVAPGLGATAAGLAAASPATPRAGAVNRACPGVTRLRHCRRGRAGGAAPARCCCHRVAPGLGATAAGLAAASPATPAPGAIHHARLGVAGLRHRGGRRAGGAAPARCCCHRVALRLGPTAAGLAAPTPT